VPNATLIRSHERCWLLQTAGRWPWKLESAKECVTTHLPKQPALKMDGAQALNLHPAVDGKATPVAMLRRVGGSRQWRRRCRAWACLEPLSVQILVVVANTRARTSRTEVEKGSMWTAVEHGWVGPKATVNSVKSLRLFFLKKILPSWPKGNPVKIPEPGCGDRLTGGFGRRLAKCGNANQLRDACESPGKSCLFFERNHTPWNRVIRR